MKSNKNKIWIYLAENEGKTKEALFEDILFSDCANRFLVNQFLKIGIAYEDEEGKLFIQKKLDTEKYIRAILLGLEQLFLDKYTTISEKEKEEVESLLLTGKFIRAEEEKRIRLQKQREKKRLEMLKRKSWLLIINDINALEKQMKNSDEMSDDLKEVIKRLKEAFMSRFQECVDAITEK